MRCRRHLLVFLAITPTNASYRQSNSDTTGGFDVGGAAPPLQRVRLMEA